jgi:hypothetical protein
MDILSKRSLVVLAICAMHGSYEAAVAGEMEPVGQAKLLALSDATAIMPEVMASIIGLLAAFTWWWVTIGDLKTLRRADLHTYPSVPMLWPVPAALAIFIGTVAWIGTYQFEQLRSLDGYPRPVKVQIIAIDSSRALDLAQIAGSPSAQTMKSGAWTVASVDARTVRGSKSIE